MGPVRPRDGGNRPGLRLDWLESNMVHRRHPTGYALGARFTRPDGPEPETMLEKLDRLGVPRSYEVVKVLALVEQAGIDLTHDDQLRLAGIVVRVAHDAEEFRRRAQEPSRLDPSARSSVYFIRHGEHVKIGWTTQTVQARLAGMQAPPGAEVVAVIPDAGRAEEAELHRRFAACRVSGEWFTLSPELQSVIDTFAI